MLPMILGFLGSAFAPALAGATGIAALSSPLLAGAIGSGLGTAVQTGDIGAGIKSGLGSFFGGKLLGGLMGSTAGAGAANAASIGPGAAVGAGGTVNPLLPQLQAQQAAAAAAPKPGLAGLFGQGAVGQGLKSGMNFMQSAEGIGSAIGSALTAPAPTVALKKDKPTEADKEMKPIPRQQLTPPPGYRPGIDPEFNYGIGTPYSYEDVLAYRDTGALPYAEGGEVKQPNEKTEIVDAISAIKGQHPQPEIALGKFVAKYGEDALRDLVDSVQSGEFDDTRERFENGENGMVRGPGDGSGVDDKVPATIDGEQDVLLADGEFVLRKDATDALEKKFGGGFLSAVNSAGDKAPEVLKKKAAA
jgi:hypothetical protein